MSGPVIIRLQNLPLEARSIDIRRFFEGLSIPDGGVHIIGGDKGDAFIAFHSDEDARQAMAKDTQILCNARIKLYLSSKTEMQNVISAARNQITTTTTTSQQSNINSKPVVSSNQYSHQQQSISSSGGGDILSKLINVQPQQPILLDQYKNIFPTSTTSTTNSSNQQQQQYLTKPQTVVNSSNLPPILADIFSKNNSTIDTYNSSSSQSVLANSNPASNAAAVSAPLLNQLNINQLLSLLTNTIQSTPNSNSTAPSTAPLAVAPTPVNNIQQQQQFNQQQYYQQQQQQQQGNNNNNNNGGVYNSLTTTSAATTTTSTKYYPSTQNYKQDQSRSSNDNYSNNKSSPSYNNNNTNRQQYNNNDRDNYPRKRQYTNDGGQYTDNFNNNENKRYDNDNRRGSGTQQQPPQRSSGGGGGGAINNSTTNSTTNSTSSTSSSSTHLDPIIRVRNFNQNCSYKDIRTFLQGIQIEHDGIKLITDSNNSRTGMAYVKLCSIIDLKKALCRNGQFYDNRSIEVVQSTQHEFFSIDNFYQKKYQNDSRQPSFQNNNNNNNNNYQSSSSRRNEQSYNHHHQPQQQQLNEQNDEYYDEINDNNNKNEDMDENGQTDGYNDNESRGGYFLKIFGLPTRFDRHSLQNEFNNVRFMRIQTIFKHELGKPMLISEVETRLDLERALTRHDEKVIRQKIQVYEMTKAEFENELNVYYNNRNNRNKERARLEGEGGDESSGGGGEDIDEYCDQQPPEDQDPNDICLFMSGVPFSARNADVKYFFQNMNLLTIYLLQDPQTQKATGECCCMFKTKEDCLRALTEKDDQLFRNRVVKIKPISYEEYQSMIINRKRNHTNKRAFIPNSSRPALQQTSNNNNIDDNHNSNNNNKRYSSNHDDDDINNNNNNNDENNGDDNQIEDQIENNEDDYDDRNEDDQQQQQQQQPQQQRNRYNNNNNNNYNNNRQKFGQSNNRGGFNNNRNNNNNNGFKRRANTSQSPHDYNNQDTKRPRPNNELPPLPPELAGIENLVLLRNVSHKASRDDIIDMLRAYNAVEHTLKIRQYDTGKPTGEAIVAFNTRDDVVNFIQQMNGTSYMGRPLRITEVN